MKQRILTGLIGGSAFLTLVWLGDIWYTALIFLIAFVSYYEFIRMKGLSWYLPSVWVGFLLLLYFLTSGFKDWGITVNTPIFLWMITFLFLSTTVLSKNKTTVTDVAYLFLGSFYTGFGFYYMLMTRIDLGLEWLLLIIFCVWATDTGAYFSGLLLGKHPLWPSISPKKTIEGSMGGIVFSILVATFFYIFGNVVNTLQGAMILGAAIAIIGQIGDLIESAIKRHLNVKDSSQILPGHGGFLDRFDSMIIVFPALFFIIQSFYI